MLAEKRPAQEKRGDLWTAIKHALSRSLSAADKRGRLWMDRVTAEPLDRKIDEHVIEGSIVVTGDYRGYWNMPPVYDHKSISHSAKKYVRTDGDFKVHTNTVESKFSLLKRGTTRTFHQVSKKHLPLYLAEFDHRFNHRKDTDGEVYGFRPEMRRGKAPDVEAIKARS